MGENVKGVGDDGLFCRSSPHKTKENGGGREGGNVQAMQPHCVGEEG